MTEKRADLARYGLYGENEGLIAPEFLHIEQISARASLYEWDISAHSHSTLHQIILLDEGSAVLHADQREMRLGPKTLIAIPSHCIHALHFSPKAEGWVLSAATDLLHHPRLARAAEMAAFRHAHAGVAQLDPEGREIARLRWTMAQIAADLDLAGPGQPSNLLLAEFGLLLTMADELLGQEEAGSALSRQGALAREFRALVDREFAGNWPMSRYARELRTTEPTLTRACRAAFGKAPGEVIHARLLLEAMRYLTYSSASISQISGKLGFADPAYFARFFKGKTGRTASEFRRERAWASAPPNRKAG